MKRLLPFSAFVLSIVHISAQPVLDFGNTGTLPGDHFTYNACPWVDPGPAGMNQTWDLTALTIDSLIEIEFVDPSTTPDGPYFPAATIAAVGNGGNTYSQFDAAGGWFHGMSAQPGDPPIVYSDPMQWVSYPTTFGTTWTDPFHSDFTVGGFNVVRDGTINGEADAYGTLQLPWGELTDVLRATYVEDYTDQSGLISMVNHREYTHFMQADTHYPIVEIFSFSTTILGNTTTISGTHWMVAGSVGMQVVQAPSASLMVWPNPATDVVYIDLMVAAQGENVVLELLNASGVIIEHRDLGSSPTGRRTEQFRMDALASGLYMLRLVSAGGMTSRRIAVQ